VINSCPTTIRLVYDTHRRTKLAAPETISRSRYMVGAHQNFSGSRDLTTPLSGMVCHPWASTCYTYLPNLKSNSTHYEDMKGKTKCPKWGGMGYLWALKVTGSSINQYSTYEFLLAFHSMSLSATSAIRVVQCWNRCVLSRRLNVNVESISSGLFWRSKSRG